MSGHFVNHLARASQWLITRQFRYASMPVEYRHHGQTDKIHVLIGGHDAQSLDDGGVAIDFMLKDFLILAASLNFEPEPGDRILFDGIEYEVLALGHSGCWRWSDAYHLLRRVHTKSVGGQDQKEY